MTHDEVVALMPQGDPEFFILSAVTKPQAGVVKTTTGMIVGVQNDGLMHHERKDEYYLYVTVVDPGVAGYTMFGTPLEGSDLGLTEAVHGELRQFNISHITELASLPTPVR